MTFFFACGGSAGHINPALAMAELLRKEYPKAGIAFLGDPGGMECRLVKEAGHPFFPIRVQGLRRSFSISNLRTLSLALQAIRKTTQILKQENASLLIGTGGYVTYPAVVAAHRLHLPTVLHESNAVPGLAIRLCERKADKILLQFSACQEQLRHPQKAVVTGTPLRSGFAKVDRDTARKKLGLGKQDLLILSFGGSLGAENINRACLALMKNYVQHRPHLRHIHGCGERYYASLKAEDRIYSPRTLLLPYISDMPSCMCAADLVICRSGAMTIAELSAVGRAAILIPSPNVSGNHQFKNAKALEKDGCAFLLQEKDLMQESLTHLVDHLLSSPSLRREAEDNIRKSAAEDADSRFLAEIESLL